MWLGASLRRSAPRRFACLAAISVVVAGGCGGDSDSGSTDRHNLDDTVAAGPAAGDGSAESEAASSIAGSVDQDAPAHTSPEIDADPFGVDWFGPSAVDGSPDQDAPATGEQPDDSSLEQDVPPAFTLTAEAGALTEPGVTVPDVMGLTKEEARSALESAGFEVVVDGASGDEPAGVVMRTVPRPGETAAAGDRVRLVMSTELPGSGGSVADSVNAPNATAGG